MKTLFTVLNHLWSSFRNLQRKDVKLDRWLTVCSPSEMTAKREQKDKLNSTCLRSASVLPPFRVHYLRYAAVALFILLGVGNVWGASTTYTHDFDATIPSGDNTLSTISWTASSLSNVGNYNSTNYKGVQIGTGSLVGAITLTSKNNWGAQSSTSFYGYTKVKKVYVWMNAGANGTVSATVTIGGKSATSDGVTVSKNSSASSQRDGTTKVTFTPAASGNTGSIVITVTKGTANASAGYLCAIQVECEEPDVSYNVDWYVGGTRTKQETGVTSGTPPSVADNALGGSCSSLKFLGWSETNIGSTPDDAPADLFSSDNVPSLTGNKTFYAVFGEVSYDTDGTPVKTQTHQYDTWTYSGTTADKTSYRLFGSDAYVQTDAFDLSGLTEVIVYGGTFGGTNYNGISIKDASGNVWKEGPVSGSSQTGINNFTGGVSLTGTKALRVYSTSGDGASNGVRISKVEVYTYPLEYSNCVTSCAACSADPTVGVAQLNGAFDLDRVGVTATDWAAGTNCAWTDYGFVWGTSANPTVSNNKVQVGTSGTATTWDGDLTGTFSTGTTYYYRAYGKNGKDGAEYQYSEDATFTPRSITLNEWWNPATENYDVYATVYAASGTPAVKPDDPTKSGYTFAGWYTEAGLTNAVDWSGNITENKIYYAKWTGTPYTITLNNQDATSAGTTSISVTYGESTNLSSTPAITVPTKTGYTFGGYYTEENGGGSQIIDEEGNVIAEADDGVSEIYTDEYKQWLYAGNITLYAKWAINNYTVSWSVNGSSWSSGVTSSNNNADYNTTVNAPTAPTSSDCDGSKVFVGWTNEEYSDDDTPPTVLFTSPSPAITANTTFYAVFADEGEGGAGYSKLDWGGTVTAGQYLLSTGTYTITGPDGNKTSQLAATTFTPPASAAASSYEVTIALIGDYFTIQLAEGRYIGWSSSTSTNLTKDAPTSETDAYLWKYTANGIQNKAAETRYLQINAAGTYGKVYTTEAEGTNWLRTYLYSTGSVSYSDYATTCSTDPRISASPSSSWAFGEVNVGSNSSKTFIIRGANLTAGITAALSGTDAGMFSISSSSIAHPGCNGSNDIVVTYRPTASGSHTATLTLSSTGATDKVITLTGTGVVTCTTPELSFASAVVTKYADAANFTNPLTVKGNERNAAVTYSSSDDLKASVNASTGEVTINAVTDENSPVTITATIAAAADNGTSCQNTTSASYNLVIAHKITWYVNGSEYTEGAPTTAVAHGGSIVALPDDPDGTAVCGNKVFVGWTESSSYSNASTAPGDLFISAEDAPTIDEDKTFYAVFASGSGTLNTYKKGTSEDLTNGQKVLIVNKNSNVALSSDADAGYSDYYEAVSVSPSEGKISNPSSKLIWTIETATGGVKIKQGDKMLYVWDDTNSNTWLWCDNDGYEDIWSISGSNPYVLTSGNKTSYKLEYYATYGYFTVYTGTGNYYNMDFYVPDATYTDYSTTCTTPYVVTVTSGGHGTAEASNTYVVSGGSTTLTLTPAAGYGCESVTLSSETATVVTLTDCECTITSITSDIEVNVTFAKLPVYSVTFDAGTGRISGGSATTTTISETTRGSGVMAPTAITCAEDWTFAYWSTTDVTTGTPTVPPHTADAGARYIPEKDNMTLYAVYTLSTGTPEYTYGTDDITVSTTGVTVNKYTDWSGKSVTTGAVYAGNSAKNYSVMALRDKDPSAIVSTTSGGTLNQVTITWDSHTAADRIVRVYGYNTAYEEPTDVYGTNGTQIKGKLLGSLTYDGSTATNTLDVTGSYQYVGIRAKDGSAYISNIAVKWITAISGLTTNYWSRPECDDCTEATFGFEKSAVTLTYPYAGTYTNTFTTNNTNAKSFTSSTPAVATVNGSTGAITIVGIGTTTITVHQNRMTTEAKYCAVDDSYELTVREASVDVVEVNNNNDIIVEHEFGGNTNALIDQLVLHEKGNVAEEVFVSKYFEASGSVKLVALYNGTGKDADPSKYRIRSVGGSKTQHIVKVGDYAEEWPTGKELIFYSWDTGNSNDLDVMECVNEKNDNGEIRLSDWIAVPWNTYHPTKPGIIFGGEEAVVLEEYDGESWNILDIVGALTADGKTADHTNITAKGSISWGDHDAWYCTNGRELRGDEDEDFALATVRCLLVRKFDVTSGKASRNTTTGNLGTGYFNTLCTEWYGKHVSKSDATQSTCDAFTEVGKFDYYNHYTKYEELNTDAFSATNNADGTMTIHIDPTKVEGGLAGLSCNFLKIKITNEDQSETLANVEYRVPIIVAADKTTNDAIFTKFEDCSVCDVVILKDYTLTTDESGKNELHDVEVYRGAKLSVPEGKELTVRNLILRSLGDVVPQADVMGTLNRANTKLYFDKRVDETQWYWMTLPYDCNVADVTFRNGETPTYGIGEDWVLQTYNGRKRADTRNGGCWEVYTGDVIQKGVGYILGVTPKSGHDYVELRFPMTATAWDKDAARATIDVPVMGTKGESEGVPVNDRGWNLVGNPYLTNYSKGKIGNTTAGTDGTNIIPQGLLVETIGSGYDYEGTVRYVNIPQDGGYSEYQQVAIGDQPLPPFMSYFIQINGSDGVAANVQFSNTLDQQSYSPVRRAPQEYKAEDDYVVWVPFNVKNSNGESDETTLLVSNRFTDGYDMMDDLTKWRGDYYWYAGITTKPVLATRNNAGEMAFNALPDSSAVTGIPVNFFAAYAGNYTFSINGKYGLDEVKEVQLWDATTQQYYDLLADDYTFTTSQGENDNRFTLYVRVERKKTPNVETGTDNILDGKLSLVTIAKTLVLSGLTDAADVYVYDMSGKLMNSDHTSGNGGIWRTTVPATGAYFVRVNNADGQQTLRAIVK